jgi:2-amino-4-hydroxy-6-hydroxymethyldihydropteridine diphosphokinase
MMVMPHTAYIGMGANLGDRVANLEEAVTRLRECGEVTRVSSWYESEPVDVKDQPWFVNGVAELETELDAETLLRALLTIEKSMGRERVRDKGPRSIDLDLLLFDNETVNTPELTLPHPAMHERRFVLEPLNEIAPDAAHPVLRQTASTLLERQPREPLVRRLRRR